MTARDDNGEPRERRSVLRYGAAVATALAAIAGVVAAAWLLLASDRDPPRKVNELLIVTVVPPPPPPPPPPPQQQLPEPKMVEQTPIEQKQEEEKPIEKPKEEEIKEAKADEPPPGPLALDAKAVGPGDSFGLAGRPGGRGLLGGGGGGGSRWGWYASIVQTQIEAALRANKRTRNAVMQIQLRLWSDQSGHVTRVQLMSSTGDAELDAAIRTEVLAGLTLREPPPKDMPMPIVTRITERRPG